MLVLSRGPGPSPSHLILKRVHPRLNYCSTGRGVSLNISVDSHEPPMKTLVLVEDNQDNAELIRELLGGCYHIICFADGASALAALLSTGGPVPDLFLLDISLPGMDGTSLLLQIRAQRHLKSIPALALTAHAMKADKEMLMAAGFDAYFSKPILDEQLLLDTIEACTRQAAKTAA